MKFLSRLLLVVILLFGVFAAYLVLAPSAIEPVAWDPPSVPAMTGPLAPNELLRGASLLALGKIDGPEDIESDAQGRIYGGTKGGEVVRVQGDAIEVVAKTGGRPLGLDFAPSGALIVADALKGLLSISPAGEVTSLADSAEGVRFGFTDDVAVASDGVIYFSDASDTFGYGDHMFDLLEGKPHGRLLKYDPGAKVATTLVKDLYFANGVALSRDESFVVVNETYRYRVTRYWLKGPKTGTSEVLVDGLPGFPDGISQSGRGTFWVAMFTTRNTAGDFLSSRPLLKRMVAGLPRALWPAPDRYGLLLEIDEEGKILRSMHDTSGEVVHQVTSAHELGGALYIGHLERDRISKIAL